MTRINTNISSLIAQTNLARAQDDLATRLERLSTGLRINRGADDPSGLIVSERLRSEMKGLEQAIDNSERASSVIATTEAFLLEVSALLTSVRGLVIEAANTGGISSDEIKANQLQIDSAIQSITRISNTASFAGLPLLNGSLAYITSGIASSAISQADIFGAQFGNNTTMPVVVEVIASAQTAQLFLSASNGTLLSSVTIEVSGGFGVQTLSFVSGTQLSAVVGAVNTVRETTGVSASLLTPGNQTSGMMLNSIGYGGDEFVSVKKIGEGGEFFQTYDQKGGTETQRDLGRDVSAIINGALATGSGLEVSLNTPALSLTLDLSAAFAQKLSDPKSFQIIGGGATFQLGPSISATQQEGFGISSIAASRVGGTDIEGVRHFLDSIRSGGANSIVSGQAEKAARILDSAITDVALLRGRLGAFERNTLQTNIRSLQVGFENIASSESKIRDTDFASETAALARAQILTQAGTSVLASANLLSQNVLALLG